ncbi:MAG: SPOR domain-containing protein, partial [Aeromonas sobria]
VADPMTLASQGQGNSTAQPVTPAVKPQPKPEVVAKKPVEQPKPAPKPVPKPVPAKPVEVAKAPAPAPTKSQAGQIKSLDDLIESTMTQPTKPAPAAAAPAQGSWILQLGAFKNVDSVNALVGKLRAAGYSAHTSPRTPVQGQINRVFIGPDVSKDKLQGIQGRVSQMTGLSGSVVAYNP